MKNLFVIIVTFCLSVSCKDRVTEEAICKINGYWEIKEVIIPGQETKQYKINENIDYFQLKNLTGFRKKVAPQLDGTFLVNNASEQIKIIDSNAVFYIQYQTKYNNWKEEIIEVTDSVLVLKNKQNLEYHYKRFIPFSIK
jgi:hypothetical protein